MLYSHAVDNDLIIGDIDIIQDWITDRLTEDSIFIDIGAHIGMSCIPPIMASKPKEAILVEANPSSFKHLEANLEKYVETKYTAVNKAVWDSVGEIDFYEWKGKPSSSSAVNRFDDTVDKILVKSTTVDELLKDTKGPVVMKIDAEGCEPFILNGMKDSIHRIEAICIEIFIPALVINVDPVEWLTELNKTFEFKTLSGGDISIKNMMSLDKTDIWMIPKT